MLDQTLEQSEATITRACRGTNHNSAQDQRCSREDTRKKHSEKNTATTDWAKEQRRRHTYRLVCKFSASRVFTSRQQSAPPFESAMKYAIIEALRPVPRFFSKKEVNQLDVSSSRVAGSLLHQSKWDEVDWAGVGVQKRRRERRRNQWVDPHSTTLALTKSQPQATKQCTLISQTDPLTKNQKRYTMD